MAELQTVFLFQFPNTDPFYPKTQAGVQGTAIYLVIMSLSLGLLLLSRNRHHCLLQSGWDEVEVKAGFQPPCRKQHPIGRKLHLGVHCALAWL